MAVKIGYNFGFVICLSASLGFSQASAHHSFAMFDNNKEVVLTGTVREFQWTNPHCWIQLTVKQGTKSVDVSIEGQSPNGLVRQGWSRNSLKVGDKVAVKVHPLKDGSAGGSFMSATFADGHVLMGQVQTN